MFSIEFTPQRRRFSGSSHGKAARQPSRAKRQAKNQVCYWEDVRVDEGILSILEREQAVLASIAITFRSRILADALLIQGLDLR